MRKFGVAYFAAGLLTGLPVPGLAQGSSSDRRLDRPGDYTFTLQHGGLTRKCRIHVPARYSASGPVAGSDGTASCSPSRPVSILEIHARRKVRTGAPGSRAISAPDVIWNFFLKR